MYEFIRGILFAANHGSAVVDVHGVGFRIGISLNSFVKLPELGTEVFLYTHYHITENSQGLFGFITDQERSVFESLIGISKIGPKVALNILSGLTVEDIVNAVEQQDPARFKPVSGVGPKTAQRLVLELKGKLSVQGIPSSRPKAISESPIVQSPRDEAFTGLIALGYTENQVRTVLLRIDEIITDEAPVHEWITMALRII